MPEDISTESCILCKESILDDNKKMSVVCMDQPTTYICHDCQVNVLDVEP